MQQKPLLLVIAIAVAAALASAGCSVNFNQLETAKRLLPDVKASFVGDSYADKTAEYAWEFAFAGAVFKVFPIRVSGRQVTFRSKDNVEVIWDGESLISLKRFPGALGTYEQGGENANRWYARDGAETVRAICDPTYRWQLSPSRSGWRQTCAGVFLDRAFQTEHSVEYNSSGQIVEIRATIYPGASPASLRLLQR